jgi:hypothetical protein
MGSLHDLRMKASSGPDLRSELPERTLDAYSGFTCNTAVTVDGQWHRITRLREAVLNLKTISAVKSYQALYGMIEPVVWWEHV